MEFGISKLGLCYRLPDTSARKWEWQIGNSELENILDFLPKNPTQPLKH